jgi:signal transduction histidine kinase
MRVPLKTRSLQIILVTLLGAAFALFIYWIQDSAAFSKIVIVWEGVFLFLALLTGMVLLNRTVQHAAEKQQRQRTFLASVSHEFKTPLAGMRLSVETIALRDPPPEKRKQLIERVLAELDRLETMISRLLDSSRLEAGTVTCIPERMLLERVVSASARGMDERARRMRVTIDSDVPPELEIKADPSAVRAVLDNLIDNAIKACADREAGRIRINAVRQDGVVEMRVADNGNGFAPDESAKLFERFFRVGHGEHAKGGGSGLGLYIVHRLITLNGATVRAESEGRGKGATFTVTWPAAEEEGS